MESPAIRKDINGNIISKLNKDYHISFKNIFTEIINVECYKEYNKIDDDTSIEDFDDDNEGKFNINEYNPEKLEKMANKDPHGFSRTKCIIL